MKYLCHPLVAEHVRRYSSRLDHTSIRCNVTVEHCHTTALEKGVAKGPDDLPASGIRELFQVLSHCVSSHCNLF